MRDFFEFRASLAEAKRSSKRGDDYGTDYSFGDNFKEGMVTNIKMRDVKKITKSTVNKMTVKQQQKMWDDLQWDYALLEELEEGYIEEVQNQYAWLEDEGSDKRQTRSEIRYFEKTLKTIKQHQQLILKHEKFLQ